MKGAKNTEVTDIEGLRFERLVAKLYMGRNEHGVQMWLCQCDCGNTTLVSVQNLRSGNVRSCGCLRRELASERAKLLFTVHGQTANGVRTPVYNAWDNMIQRCENKKHPQYADYGGRGIRVCSRWHSFVNFYEDVGDQPPGLTLDRINNNAGYEPTNWRWATWEVQARNRRERKKTAKRPKTAMRKAKRTAPKLAKGSVRSFIGKEPR